MGFTKILVKDLKLEYEGLMDISEIHRIMDLWFREKSFDKREDLDVNTEKPDGTKHIEMEIEPWRKFTDYHRQRYRVRMYFWDIKNVMVEKNGAKVKMHKGKAIIFFDLFFDIDWMGKSSNPLPNFIQLIWDKYFARAINEKYENIAVDDLNHLYQTVKNYFNMPKFGEYLTQYEPKA